MSTLANQDVHVWEVFGNNQMLAGWKFTKVHFRGPGIIAYLGCNMDHCAFFGLPAAQFINPKSGGSLFYVAHQFVKCDFQECTFSNLLHVGSLPVSDPDQHVWDLSPHLPDMVPRVTN